MYFKIIMTTSLTRLCFITQHQTCKTKTKTDFVVSDRSFPKTDSPRPHHSSLPHPHMSIRVNLSLSITSYHSPCNKITFAGESVISSALIASHEFHEKLNKMTKIKRFLLQYWRQVCPPPFRLAASVSWCWSWEKEGRTVEVVPGI